jgi:hypothetical protein
VWGGVSYIYFAGKTRLLLEASKRTPLILIRLGNSNVVYTRLLEYVEQEKTKIDRDTSFEQWLLRNRRVLLYIRAFFLSYMLYAREYKGTYLYLSTTLTPCHSRMLRLYMWRH